MRAIFAGLSAMACAFMMLVFWRVHALTMQEIAVLTGGVDEVASEWDAKSLPSSLRAITFLLSDTRAASAPFLLAGDAEDGIFEKAGNWVGRNLIGGSPVAQVPTELERSFSDSTGLVRWTHKGFTRVDPYQMSKEIEKAILRAHDRGAQINIVAQGEDSVAVLMALSRLEGQVRGGVPVGANKVVFVGAKGGFRVPGNIVQLASCWTPRGSNGATQIQVFGGGKQSEAFHIDALWPPGSDSSDPTARKLKLIRGLLDSRQTFEATLAKKEADLQTSIAAAVAGDAAKQAAAAQATVAAQAAQSAAKAAAALNSAKPAAAAVGGRTAKIEWVTLEGGTFMLGENFGKQTVTIKPFQMAKSAVTNAQYRACEQAGACTPPNANCMSEGSFGADDQPVVCVSWTQAGEFSRWAGGRLATSSEWEYAARSGGRDIKYPWGNEEPTCARAVVKEVKDKSLKTGGCGRNAAWPVCSRPAGNTAQGLCDMYGNTEEWVQDGATAYGQKPPADGSAQEKYESALDNSLQDGVVQRQVRGVGWIKEYHRGVGDSGQQRPNWRYNYLSFRPVRARPAK